MHMDSCDHIEHIKNAPRRWTHLQARALDLHDDFRAVPQLGTVHLHVNQHSVHA